MSEDSLLLRRYIEIRSEAAFAELVRHHLRLVYAVALRQVGGDAHLAEDVTQQVFTSLARKARELRDRPTLAGWLYCSAHFAASDAVRRERRRRTREQEAHTMEVQERPGVSPASGNEVDWEKLRPTIDAAIAELEERDRDAVSLRFFDGRSFADVGERLRLSENAARMRVERALDKLHAALSKRGITSTSAALGIALGGQGAVQVPAGLATTITGAAVGATGVLAFLGSSKVVAVLGAGATAAALGVAVVQYDGAKQAQVSLAAVERQHHALQAELTTLNQRLIQAERRAAEAEKDNGELLSAVKQAREAAGARANAMMGNIKSNGSGPSDEQERLAAERAYQQKLAKRRAEEAKARARIDIDQAQEADAIVRYTRLMEVAAHLAENAEFQEAIRMYNRAMQQKPAEVAVSDNIKQLQRTLMEQNKPVEVTLASDGLTWVSIENVRSPQRFTSVPVKILPGNYNLVGRRAGYEDVVIRTEIRNGQPAPTLTVACSIPAATQ